MDFEAGVDGGRVWNLDVYINNDKLFTRLIEGKEKGRSWQPIKVDLSAYQGNTVVIRLYQRVLVPGKEAGNAYWKNIEIK